MSTQTHSRQMTGASGVAALMAAFLIATSSVLLAQADDASNTSANTGNAANAPAGAPDNAPAEADANLPIGPYRELRARAELHEAAGAYARAARYRRAAIASLDARLETRRAVVARARERVEAGIDDGDERRFARTLITVFDSWIALDRHQRDRNAHWLADDEARGTALKAVLREREAVWDRERTVSKAFDRARRSFERGRHQSALRYRRRAVLAAKGNRRYYKAKRIEIERFKRTLERMARRRPSLNRAIARLEKQMGYYAWVERYSDGRVERAVATRDGHDDVAWVRERARFWSVLPRYARAYGVEWSESRASVAAQESTMLETLAEWLATRASPSDDAAPENAPENAPDNTPGDAPDNTPGGDDEGDDSRANCLCY